MNANVKFFTIFSKNHFKFIKSSVLEPDGIDVLFVIVLGMVFMFELPASVHCVSRDPFSVFSLCFVLRMSLVESSPTDSMLSSGQISYSLGACGPSSTAM